MSQQDIHLTHNPLKDGKMPAIICFGEILWDIFHDADETREVLGGAPSNLCYFFNALQKTQPALLISQVGDDALGAKALAQIAALNMAHIIPVSSTLPTGRVDILIKNNEPEYRFNTPAAWDAIPFPHSAKMPENSISMIAFGSLASRGVASMPEEAAPESSFEMLKKLLNAHPNATRFLDLNLRAPHFEESRIVALLKYADILKINETEFAWLKSHFALTALSTRDALFALITKLSLNLVILTLGENGSIVMSPTDYSALNAKRVDLVNTVGAGDSFAAGFLSAINHGANFQAAHRFANDLSSYLCTQEGAFVEIPESFRQKLATFSAW